MLDSPFQDTFAFWDSRSEKYQGLTLREVLLKIQETNDWEFIITYDYNNNAIRPMLYKIMGVSEEEVEATHVNTHQKYFTLQSLQEIQYLCNYTKMDLWQFSCMSHFIKRDN